MKNFMTQYILVLAFGLLLFVGATTVGVDFLEAGSEVAEQTLAESPFGKLSGLDKEFEEAQLLKEKSVSKGILGFTKKTKTERNNLVKTIEKESNKLGGLIDSSINTMIGSGSVR